MRRNQVFHLLPTATGRGHRLDLRHDAGVVLEEGRRDAGKLDDSLPEVSTFGRFRKHFTLVTYGRKLGQRRHDTQNNDIQHNDIQHNDIQHNDTQHNDVRRIEIQHNEIRHNYIQHRDIQHNYK